VNGGIQLSRFLATGFLGKIAKFALLRGYDPFAIHTKSGKNGPVLIIDQNLVKQQDGFQFQAWISPI
jgi:hypothetical protein